MGPNEFVDLELESGLEAIGEHPFHEVARGKFSENGREEDFRLGEAESVVDDASGPFIIVAIRDNEFDLVVWRELPDILPHDPVVFAAGRALYVHYPSHGVRED